jgi:UDP-N-acetylglucosamine diphosphorylase / glucose-1-phosphate thymidylyltransferase / UDP-N-acetylgalactosamine diphosphorylase / glucosamine-1-phosphate N-acetyltransferase / galactosamine-1-phosphate N-acetyltransferase
VTRLVLYDDARARTFEPFASTRPVSEMVAGFAPIRERWKVALQPSEVQFIAGDRMLDFDEGDDTSAATGVIPTGSIIVNSRCVPELPKDITRASDRAATCSLWRCGDQVAAVRLRAPLDVSALRDGGVTLDELHAGTGAIGEVKGWWLEEVWDFIRLLPDQLASDIAQFAAQPSTMSRMEHYRPPAHATVMGDYPIIVIGPTANAPSLAKAVIEPHVVLDASAGPIMIQSGAHIRSFTRINGPCYIGRGVAVMGGDIVASSIGDVCKVRGELSSTIILGHSNKGHDGFVGHSYLGRWVNLGAGTITSNLKNTYGNVALWTPSGTRDTGLQFLGTLFGDHVKTGIGLRLTTGTVLGAGANVYGNMPPKVVAPFSWGDAPPYSTYRADKFVETAERMMSRRHVELSERARRHLAAVYAGRWKASGSAEAGRS